MRTRSSSRSRRDFPQLDASRFRIHREEPHSRPCQRGRRLHLAPRPARDRQRGCVLQSLPLVRHFHGGVRQRPACAARGRSGARPRAPPSLVPPRAVREMHRDPQRGTPASLGRGQHGRGSLRRRARRIAALPGRVTPRPKRSHPAGLRVRRQRDSPSLERLHARLGPPSRRASTNRRPSRMCPPQIQNSARADASRSPSSGDGATRSAARTFSCSACTRCSHSCCRDPNSTSSASAKAQ